MKSIKTNLRKYKNPEIDLRTYQTIIRQCGMILSLLIMITLFRIEFTTTETEIEILDVREEIVIEEIIHSRQVERVPPPPRPPMPVAVPDHVIIDNIEIFIDAELDFNAQAYLPPPPPPPLPHHEAEEEKEEEEHFFVVVEQMPELIGGLASLQNKVRYPEMARMARIEGRVIVQFIVNEKGEVENPHIVRGIGGGCDEEALRVVSQAKFTPGLQRGRPVRVQYSMPITFVLRD